jgi:phage-related protein
MLQWTPLQYRNVWDRLYAECDEDTQAALDARLDQLLEKGNLCRRPITDHLENGIFELRAKRARMLFYFGAERTIVFVHALLKDTPKIPRVDINRAKQIRKSIFEGRVIPHDLSDSTKDRHET